MEILRPPRGAEGVVGLPRDILGKGSWRLMERCATTGDNARSKGTNILSSLSSHPLVSPSIGQISPEAFSKRARETTRDTADLEGRRPEPEVK